MNGDVRAARRGTRGPREEDRLSERAERASSGPTVHGFPSPESGCHDGVLRIARSARDGHPRSSRYGAGSVDTPGSCGGASLALAVLRRAPSGPRSRDPAPTIPALQDTATAPPTSLDGVSGRTHTVTTKRCYIGYMPSLSLDPSCLTFIHTPFDPADEEPSPRLRAAVVAVRNTLERLLRDEARGVGASDADLDVLDRLLARAGAARGLVPAVRGYSWGWRRDPGEVTRRCFAAIWSAARLLTSEDRHRLKLCDGCGRLFHDASRNHSRRWCDMQGCGNRAKVRRHRAAHL